ncbi:MAG: uroporphyrinogen-III C-methyltransferase [Cytophagales bacterium]|nr:uroporphyrinogen-III C-methyltransferase [Cytophagales bacterium]
MLPDSKLTLVGAGPGDADLITLKGVKALNDADCVLYDALANQELLSHCKPEAIKIFVGKRRGKCEFSQTQINQLIIECAYKYGHVVRLKGGDPFVFGRAQEEIDIAKAFDLPVAVVPGISSAIAVPEAQMIPLTARGINESFWVTTGSTKDGQISDDIRWAAKSTATVIVLMAMSRLQGICEIFISEGKALIPTAIIQNGTQTNEKFIIGTVSDISVKAREANIDNPAIIMIGEVVALHPQWAKQKAYVQAGHIFQ